MRKTLYIILIAAFSALLFAGCGGGGGGSTGGAGDNGNDDSGIPPAGPSNYALIELASGEVGAEPSTVAAAGVSLTASLQAPAEVTISERFYTSGRPAGAIGKIYDIKPDGLQFKPGTRLCIDYTDTDYAGDELTIVTGENLDVELAGVNENGRLCAELAHSSPYGFHRASNLHTPDHTIFGDLFSDDPDDVPDDVKVVTGSGTDYDRGGYMSVKITVNCEMECISSGERTFRIIQGGAYDGDIYIQETGTYSLWMDMDSYKWTAFKNEAGALLAGVPYLLAAEYINYFLGTGIMSTYIAALDPTVNRIQRFFYREGEVQHYLYIDVARDETASPGKITVGIDAANHPFRTYVIDRTTAAITKTWVSAVDGLHTETAAPGDAAYAALNQELLYYIYVLVGIEDTPDYTAGDPYDQYPRYTPNQELFAVNVMNLLKGLGWSNLGEIEAYYRDRQKAMEDPAD